VLAPKYVVDKPTAPGKRLLDQPEFVVSVARAIP
jgi:hypothetical protein